MASSGTVTSPCSLWFVVLDDGYRPVRLSGTAEPENICRLYPTDLHLKPPARSVQLSSKANVINVSIGVADQCGPIRWLKLSDHRCFCGHSGFRWQLLSSEPHSVNFWSDTWPTWLELEPMGKSSEKQHRFEIEEPASRRQKDTIVIPLSGDGTFSCIVEDSSRSFVLTNLNHPLKKFLDDVKDRIDETDALYRVSTALTHAVLIPECHENKRFLSAVISGQKFLRTLLLGIWTYSIFRNDDPLFVVNNLITVQRPRDAPLSESELVALLLAQSSACLIVLLSVNGEIDSTGQPYRCRRFAVHPNPKRGELRFLCTDFVMHTFHITLGQVPRNAVRFENLSFDTDDSTTEIAE